jgi:hypothetical protein
MAPTPHWGDPTAAAGGNPRGMANHQPGMDPDQGSTNGVTCLLPAIPNRQAGSLSIIGRPRQGRLGWDFLVPRVSRVATLGRPLRGPQPFLPVRNRMVTVMTRTGMVGQWHLGYNKFVAVDSALPCVPLTC